MIRTSYTLACGLALLLCLHISVSASSKLDPKLIKDCHQLKGCLEVCIDKFSNVWKKLEEKYPRIKPNSNGLSWTQFSCTWGCAKAQNLVPKCISYD